ncbi:MAG: acyltransferase [Clostridiaceae bacterium]|nr:acyltransferase [Clostridiaceae bacterium]
MAKVTMLFKYLIRFIWSKLSPIGYAKHLGVRLGNNVRFYGMKPSMFSTEPWLISIGNDCYITANCTFITHDGGTLILRKEVPDLEITAPITIGNDVFIGYNSTILAGTTIGNRCIVGACSLLKGEYPDNSVIAGVPARVIKTVDEYLENAKANSLHLGHLDAKEKAKALKKHFGITD